MFGDSRRAMTPIHCWQPFPYVSTGRRSTALHRLFTSFPGGWPGVGLLLLRLATGAAVATHGASYFAGHAALSLWSAVTGTGSVLIGTLLLLGFLTPFAGMLALVVTGAAAFSLLPAPDLNPFDAPMAAALLASISAALAFLGPGALSVDARLFGRREIVIPRIARSDRP